MLALVLVAFSLGLSNFAAAVGIGVAGVDARTRVRVGVVFGIFEAGMPILGLALGHSLAGALGHAAHWVGGGLLIATGGYGLIQASRAGAEAPGSADGGQQLGRLLVTGIALSIDNLAVGFALGAYHVGLPLAAAVIGTVSVVMSLAGLELGARIGMRAGQRGELLGGLVLIGVGAAIGTASSSQPIAPRQFRLTGGVTSCAGRIATRSGWRTCWPPTPSLFSMAGSARCRKRRSRGRRCRPSRKLRT